MSDVVEEWRPFRSLELTDNQVRTLALSKAFEIAPDPSTAGRWIVNATQYVGAANLDGLELRVTPKVGVYRLFELLCTSIRRIEWSDEDAVWAESNDLVATIAGAFTRHAERVMQQGLVQGYHQLEESMLGVRGRVAIGRQLARRPGLPLPIEVTYDDYTVDVIENQLLAGAGRVLLRMPNLPPLLRTRLRRLEYRLIDVTPARPTPHTPDLAWTRLNERYRSATALARLILQNSTLEERGDRNISGTAFLVDMNKVFEDIVGIGLRDALTGSGSTVELQRPIKLGAESSFGATPDIVIRQGQQVVAVADVKYINSQKGISTSELYQAVTYATHFRLDSCTLIYPQPQRVRHVRIGDVTVFIDHLDLALPAAQRREVLKGMAQRLRSASQQAGPDRLPRLSARGPA